MERLSNKTLGDVPAYVATPHYQRSGVPTRMVHLGTGAFHRSHQALYTDDVMQKGDARWGVFAASTHNPAIGEALTPQDGLYTAVIDNNGTKTARIVAALNTVTCLATARQAVLDHLSSPLTEVVTLTITEKGYCFDSLTGTLNEAAPEIALDLAAPQSARSVIGVLAWSIYQRKQRGVKPFTLLSCDHLVNNGKVLQQVLEHYIERVQDDLKDPDLLQYFLDQYACPCSLVDRITPLPTANDVAAVSEFIGLYDAAPVITEPFSRWVIQDWFSADRPKWEEAGAILTNSVDPYQQLAHSLRDASYLALAYLGGVAGYATAAGAMQSPEIAAFVSALMDHAVAALPKHSRVDSVHYKQALLTRFSNTSLSLSTAQLAMDGSKTLPYSILEPINIRLSRGLNIDCHAVVVAAWMRYLMGRNERQEVLQINDPLHQQLQQAVQHAGGHRADANDLVDALLGIRAIFGNLPNDLEFVRSVAAALQNLLTYRVQGSLAQLLNTADSVK